MSSLIFPISAKCLLYRREQTSFYIILVIGWYFLRVYPHTQLAKWWWWCPCHLRNSKRSSLPGPSTPVYFQKAEIGIITTEGGHTSSWDDDRYGEDVDLLTSRHNRHQPLRAAPRNVWIPPLPQHRIPALKKTPGYIPSPEIAIYSTALDGGERSHLKCKSPNPREHSPSRFQMKNGVAR